MPTPGLFYALKINHDDTADTTKYFVNHETRERNEKNAGREDQPLMAADKR
jgi:hypothetical protein